MVLVMPLRGGGNRSLRQRRPDGLHPTAVRERVEMIGEPLLIVYENSWRIGKIPEHQKKTANTISIFKKKRNQETIDLPT